MQSCCQTLSSMPMLITIYVQLGLKYRWWILQCIVPCSHFLVAVAQQEWIGKETDHILQVNILFSVHLQRRTGTGPWWCETYIMMMIIKISIFLSNVTWTWEVGRYQSNCRRDLPRSNGHSQDPFTRRTVSLVSENQLLCPLSYLVNQMIQMWLYNDSYRLTCGPEMAEREICEGECQDQCQTINEATPGLI